jgi:SAM-dependent methyltransferase
MTRNISQYESAYLADYGFESAMVAYRHRLLLERLTKHCPKSVVEIGCGAELLYRHYLDQAGSVDRWIIVEPGQQFADAARGQALPNLYVIQAFFEDVAEDIRQSLPAPPQLVVCSSVLHEVPDAGRLLNAIASIMGKETLLHVNVPNAKSFHRRLAKSMGLVHDLKAMSDRNQQLLQHRVYDRETLDADIRAAGLSVSECGGYLVKPFTHGQMERITSLLGEQVLDGLYQLGKEAPEWASEIYVEACRVSS